MGVEFTSCAFFQSNYKTDLKAEHMVCFVFVSINDKGDCMQRASERDREILDSLRNEFLIDHIPDQVKSLPGVVHIMCSDPFRCPESHQNICRLIPKQVGNPNPIVFPLYYPGGSLILAPDSPVLPEGSTMDRDWIEAIRMAYEMFDIKAVLAEAHIACAKAYQKKLDAFRVCELNLAAKRRVEEEVPGVQFYPLLHTHGFRVLQTDGFSEERMLTYHIPSEKWDKKTHYEMQQAVQFM
jgi:hypothetical protein